MVELYFCILGIIGFMVLLWGAEGLLHLANLQGFIGIATYLACWTYLWPIMLAISFFFAAEYLYALAFCNLDYPDI